MRDVTYETKPMSYLEVQFMTRLHLDRGSAMLIFYHMLIFTPSCSKRLFLHASYSGAGNKNKHLLIKLTCVYLVL